MVRGDPGRREMESAIAGPLLVRNPPAKKKYFAEIARNILKRSREDHGFNRLLLFSALENHKLARKFFRVYIAEYCQVLAGFIRSRIRTGAFRKIDPLLAARGFVGMVYYHYLAQEILGGASFHKFNEAAAARTMARVWLHGVRA